MNALADHTLRTTVLDIQHILFSLVVHIHFACQVGLVWEDVADLSDFEVHCITPLTSLTSWDTGIWCDITLRKTISCLPYKFQIVCIKWCLLECMCHSAVQSIQNVLSLKIS